MSSSNEFILPGDQIVAINSTIISDSKDINLRVIIICWVHWNY